MYDYIKGKLTEITPTQAIVETGGIGYKLEISLQTFTDIQSLEDIKLFIYYHVKEDMAVWYGFFKKEERAMFMMLINVNGIGPNTARMILSSLTTEELKNAIISDDIQKIKAVKGIGLKTAQRVIIELKDKMIKGGDTLTLPLGEVKSAAAEEALSALTMLGFAKPASQKAIDAALKAKPGASVEEIIKISLKNL
ncbi:MAG: Holliday junction branch migration protein RuvA [Candidatus Egerieousia sp.]